MIRSHISLIAPFGTSLASARVGHVDPRPRTNEDLMIRGPSAANTKGGHLR
jgi:hypothetical protein